MLAIDWMCMAVLLVVNSFFLCCRPQLCRLARSLSLRTVQLAEQSNRVKE